MMKVAILMEMTVKPSCILKPNANSLQVIHVRKIYFSLVQKMCKEILTDSNVAFSYTVKSQAEALVTIQKIRKFAF